MPEMPVQEAALNFPHFGAARTAIGKLLYWRYRLFQQRRHDAAVLERIGDCPLLVMPGVLNPRLTRSGGFFASQLSTGLVSRGSEVLDMGTGSGVCAIVAAHQARRVVAVDINPAAVRCARINALLNHLEDRIEVTHGDLFAPVQGRRFDIVLFNPPFVHGTPSNDADRAWRSTDVAERFAEGLTGHLTPTGFALVVLSTYGDPGRFVRHFRRCGFEMTPVAVRTFINEQLTLVRLQQPPRSGSVQ